MTADSGIVTADSGGGPGCVKSRKNSAQEKIDLSEPPLRDFLDAGKGHPTHENFVFLRFYTASAEIGHDRPEWVVTMDRNDRAR